jgi:hypothetical protein
MDNAAAHAKAATPTPSQMKKGKFLLTDSESPAQRQALSGTPVSENHL